MKMKWLIELGTLILLFALFCPTVEALEPETLAAIQGAALVGSAISEGKIDPNLAAEVVRNLRKGGLGNAGIRDVFRAIREDGTTGLNRKESGLGAFIKEAHAQGLRGRALANAIHEEQARRGVPGKLRAKDHPSGEKKILPESAENGATEAGKAKEMKEKKEKKEDQSRSHSTPPGHSRKGGRP